MTSQIEQQDSNVQGHLPECFMAARLGVDTYAPDVLAQMKRAGCICDRLRACEERVRLEDDDYAYVAAQSESEGRWRGWSEALDAAREVVAALESNPELEIDWDRDYAVDPSGATRNRRVWLRDAVAAIDALREEQSSGGQGILKCSACKCDLQWLSNRLVHLGDASELCDVHMQEHPPPIPPSVGVPTTPMWPAR